MMDTALCKGQVKEIKIARVKGNCRVVFLRKPKGTVPSIYSYKSL